MKLTTRYLKELCDEYYRKNSYTAVAPMPYYKEQLKINKLEGMQKKYSKGDITKITTDNSIIN